jgi:hypothetical protein
LLGLLLLEYLVVLRQSCVLLQSSSQSCNSALESIHPQLHDLFEQLNVVAAAAIIRTVIRMSVIATLLFDILLIARTGMELSCSASFWTMIYSETMPASFWTMIYSETMPASWQSQDNIINVGQPSPQVPGGWSPLQSCSL